MLFSMYFVHTAPSDALQLGRSVQTLEDDWKQTYRRECFEPCRIPMDETKMNVEISCIICSKNLNCFRRIFI